MRTIKSDSRDRRGFSGPSCFDLDCVLVFSDVPASIAHFISLEVVGWSGMFRRGFLPAGGHRALVTVIGMEVVIDMTVKVGGTMKPRASANEDAAVKPLGAVVAVGGTTVRSSVVVAVRTVGGDADVDVDLRLCSGSTGCKAKAGGCGQCEHFQSTHKFHLMLVREASIWWSCAVKQMFSERFCKMVARGRERPYSRFGKVFYRCRCRRRRSVTRRDFKEVRFTAKTAPERRGL